MSIKQAEPAPCASILVDVREAGRLIGVKRTLVFSLLRQGQLVRCKIGHRTLITRASIEQLVTNGVNQSGGL